MKTRGTALIAWGAVGIAIIAWSMYGMFLSSIWSEHDARTLRMTDAQEAAARESTSIRLHALARDTKGLRDQLEGLAHVDVLDVANTIQNAGKLAGVKIKIGNVLSSSATQDDAQNPPALNEIDFLVEAEGSFAALTRATALFETLPIPSFLKSVELERELSSNSESKEQDGMWRMMAHILVLSSSNISS